MKSRNLFAELAEGFEALAVEREGKRTLPSHAQEDRPTLAKDAEDMTATQRRESATPGPDE